MKEYKTQENNQTKLHQNEIKQLKTKLTNTQNRKQSRMQAEE